MRRTILALILILLAVSLTAVSAVFLNLYLLWYIPAFLISIPCILYARGICYISNEVHLAFHSISYKYSSFGKDSCEPTDFIVEVWKLLFYLLYFVPFLISFIWTIVAIKGNFLF